MFCIKRYYDRISLKKLFSFFVDIYKNIYRVRSLKNISVFNNSCV